MGGRGTFAIRNIVPYTYRTVDIIEGIKVLQGIEGKHGLPESSHSSNAYIKLNSDGTFREMRFYGEDHVLYMEIAISSRGFFDGESSCASLTLSYV